MGKTPKPLRILVLHGLGLWPEWDPLKAQGHDVVFGSDGPAWDYDLIVGPQAWHMTEKHKPYLEDAIKAARQVRYGKKGGA